jgi:hypothetical protein
MILKIKDFLKLENVSIDMSDDYDSSLGIAYESGYELTKEGEEYFKDILDFEVEAPIGGGDYAFVKVAHIYDNWEEPTEEDENFEDLINAHGDLAHPLHWKIYDLFEGLGGYCSTENYEKWFRKVK